MAYTDYVPNKDIRIDELGESLNNWGGSVTVNQPHTYFTAAANINMWSRMKPVKYVNSDEPNRSGEWWKGSAGDCGISYNGSYNAYSYIKQYYDAGNTVWEYELPAGGSSNPLRLGDFQYYLPTAEPPIQGFAYTQNPVVGGTLEVQFDYINSSQGDKSGPGSLELEDISLAFNGHALSEFGVGLMLYSEDGSTFKGYAVGSGSGVEVECSAIGAGTYRLYPFLGLNQQSWTGSASDNTFITVPGISGPAVITITSQSAGWTLTCAATYTSVNSGCSYEVRLTNNGSSSQSCGSGSAIFYYENRSALDDRISGEVTVTLSSQTISAGSTYTWSGSVTWTNSGAYEGAGHRLYVSFPSISMTANTDIENLDEHD